QGEGAILACLQNNRFLMRRYFFAVIKKLLLAALAIGLAMGLGVQLWLAAWVWHYRDHPPIYTPFMHLGTGSPGAPKLQYQWVERNQIAPVLEQAVLAAEDARFMEHKGWIGKAFAAHTKKTNLLVAQLQVVLPSPSNWLRTYFYPVKKPIGAKHRKLLLLL